ncbi:MAG: IMP dehydrogenase [Clostridiales bacterium]|uniref:IMP dehydrogenase n=1 Tax=Terrisporobacter sp. TaxID=1965305 RepID=UPI002A5621B7|nr:IMP dehydrogenase [Terrisporobacter sp.]MDD7756368.1 IMP dehydrogenase [Clostridiales bacterium]MDY4135620.1 IMP dehydrogenase [Terrisporobacter sp.]
MENKIKYGYDDINIVPEISSSIEHRSECKLEPFLFTAPMSSVVNLDNIRNFIEQGIIPIIPRNIDFIFREISIYYQTSKIKPFDKSKIFIALSLEEINTILINKPIENIINSLNPVYICIDIANGHMQKLLNTIKKLKELYGENIVIMSGNIANPETYKLYEEVGCDYVRCGIGGGAGCITASNTGVYYPLFSLLEETYKIKKSINGKCKIIADGGIRNYCDIQKALLYADYVMLGSMLNKAIESAGKTTYGKSYFVTKRGKKILNIFRTIFEFGREVPKEKYNSVIKRIKSGKLEVWKSFYGMSTKRAQSEMGNKKLKTSEGIEFSQKVEYSLKDFIDNENSYLRSAMSYTNSKTLDEYKDKKWISKLSLGHNK